MREERCVGDDNCAVCAFSSLRHGLDYCCKYRDVASGKRFCEEKKDRYQLSSFNLIRSDSRWELLHHQAGKLVRLGNGRLSVNHVVFNGFPFPGPQPVWRNNQKER